MKLADAIARIDTSPENTQLAAVEPFEKALGLNTYLSWDDDFAARVKKHWLSKWYDSDSWVGTAVYTMDGRAVAVGTCNSRKADEDVEFLSAEIAEEMRTFILSLSEPDPAPVADLERDIGDGYTVNYGSELLADKGFYRGQPVEVLSCWNGHHDVPSKEWSLATVRLPDGATERIHLKDLVIPYCLSADEAPAPEGAPGMAP
jgi:hypothetical protein